MFYRQPEFGVVFMTNGTNGYHIFPEIIKLTVGGEHQEIIDFGEFLDDDVRYSHIDEDSLSTWWKFYKF